MEDSFNFKLLAKDKKTNARAGRITAAHGVIDTPSFVPVGTQATVKSLTPQDLKEIGVQILFGNTYHLHLRPGEDIVEKFGGLGKFMGWNGPTMTDSGGFQVFSLGRAALRSLRQFGDSSNSILEQSANIARADASKYGSKDSLFKSSPHAKAPRAAGVFGINEDDGVPKLVKINEDSVVFRSHLDGSLHEFTPEKSIEIQKKLGADIILVFDECAPHPSSHEYTRQAMERTHRWALRSLAAHKSEIRNSKSETISNVQNPNDKNVSNFDIRYSNFGYYPWRQALYGIIQGGVYKVLREESARFISSLALSLSTSLGVNSAEGFDGIAIGGVSVGESKKQMRDALDWVTPFLPEEKPRHLLGIGEVDDIFDSIERGMDTFDCVIPTRLGRYGFVFVNPAEGNRKNKFMIDIKKTVYSKDKGPLTKDCSCSVCTTFTRGYVHHLFRVQELLAYRLASYHNLYFINNLFSKIRNAILEGGFEKLKREWMD